MDKPTCAAVMDALDYALTTLDHAMELGYLGEGSTKGLAEESLRRLETAETLMQDEWRKLNRAEERRPS